LQADNRVNQNIDDIVFAPSESERLPRRFEFVELPEGKVLNEFKFPLLLVLLHVPLGLILYNTGSFALIHPIGAFVIGMRYALIGGEKLERVAHFAAYIVGAEILWRMAGIPIFWEFGKYGAACIMIAALIKRRFWSIPAFALFFFAMLIPAAFVTLVENSLFDARNMISFNLSGPFFLFISCWFFSHLKLDELQIRKLLIAAIVPLFCVAVTTLFYTVTTEEIEFNGESNFATSGGFGPNQVSAMLGLGAFLCFACFLLFKNTFEYKLFFGLVGLLLVAECVLTFSRGGIYNAIGALILIVAFQLRDIKANVRRILPVIAIVVLFVIIVFPLLDNFTGGALEERFEDKDSTGRLEIVDADFKIFINNPLLGVGLGNAYAARQEYLYPKKAVSHTEFSRLTAEHGIFGIFAILSLILMIVFNLRRQTSVIGKALTAGLIAWSCLFMMNAGMRLAAPSLILGMIYLCIENSRNHRSNLSRFES
jgi:O-antigen ligase